MKITIGNTIHNLDIDQSCEIPVTLDLIIMSPRRIINIIKYQIDIGTNYEFLAAIVLVVLQAAKLSRYLTIPQIFGLLALP